MYFPQLLHELLATIRLNRKHLRVHLQFLESAGGTLGINSKASVTVIVTWVCVKDSSSIQSGWREVKLNLRGKKTQSVSYK